MAKGSFERFKPHISSPSPSSSPTAGTTGTPATPTSLRQFAEKELHGKSDGISTQRHVNALQAQADHGLTPAGADSFCRGQQPAFLADQTKLSGKNLLPHELSHVIQQ